MRCSKNNIEIGKKIFLKNELFIYFLVDIEKIVEDVEDISVG